MTRGSRGNAGLVFAFCVAAALTLHAQTTFTGLVSFNGTDGEFPSALIEGTDGNLYGVTPSGGTGAACTFSPGCGTVFTMTPAGGLTTLYNFCSQPNCADGEAPVGPLVQGNNGNFY